MGDIEEGEIYFLEVGRPAEGADCDKAAQRFDKVAVEGRFRLEVEETDLSGGAEVVFLKDCGRYKQMS